MITYRLDQACTPLWSNEVTAVFCLSPIIGKNSANGLCRITCLLDINCQMSHSCDLGVSMYLSNSSLVEKGKLLLLNFFVFIILQASHTMPVAVGMFFLRSTSESVPKISGLLIYSAVLEAMLTQDHFT